jgi:hypothetical protein
LSSASSVYNRRKNKIKHADDENDDDDDDDDDNHDEGKFEAEDPTVVLSRESDGALGWIDTGGASLQVRPLCIPTLPFSILEVTGIVLTLLSTTYVPRYRSRSRHNNHQSSATSTLSRP